jgi:orotidine-5'-phosphate decarboxylase
MLPTSARERLILALDFGSAQAALDHLDRLEGQCLWVKVGLELYLAAGPAILETLAQRGHRIFLDLKLHDIPNTVAGAVRSLQHSGASLLTLHAAGGSAMLAAAAAASSPDGPRLLAVTVLTSMDGSQLNAIGVHGDPGTRVQRLAALATGAGIPGLVCSPAEVLLLRQNLGAAPLLVVPGVRPQGADVGDQRRVATPAEAIRDGASLLVVGRPITQAPQPAEAFRRILDEIDNAEQAKGSR